MYFKGTNDSLIIIANIRTKLIGLIFIENY